FGIAAIGYGVLELVEGYGLWRRFRWAEWLTVIATSLLIPVELYELVHRPSALKAAGLAVNVLIVLYPLRVVRRRRASFDVGHRDEVSATALCRVRHHHGVGEVVLEGAPAFGDEGGKEAEEEDRDREHEAGEAHERAPRADRGSPGAEDVQAHERHAR